MKELYVRVQPKQGVARFFRCGIGFSQAWKKVVVDTATASRLEAEQMLEVSDTKPADYEETEAGDSAGNTSTAANGSGTPAAALNTGVVAEKPDEALGGKAPPDDPAVRLEAIRAAIAQLDKEDAALWTAGGKAKTEAIAAITGWPVSAAERDAALEDGDK
jgi:hypothetical protein